MSDGIQHKPLTANEAGQRCIQQGYAYPIQVLMPKEAAVCRCKLEEYESKVGDPLKGDSRFNIHLLLPWAWELVHHPMIIELVRVALDDPEGIYCWSSDINLKEPNSDAYFTWHQDSTYASIEPPSAAVTVWIALSDSNLQSGCVESIPFSHQQGQLRHNQGRGGERNVLSLRQEIDFRSSQEFHTDIAEAMVLEAGQASIHSFLTVHASKPNTGNDRRIGLALRYVSGQASKKGTVKEIGTLVSGKDTGLFELAIAPKMEMGKSEVAHHASSMEKERLNYLSPGGQYQ